jgi:hypothetical protein
MIAAAGLRRTSRQGLRAGLDLNPEPHLDLQ